MKRTKTAVGVALLAWALLAMLVGGSLAQGSGWEKTFGGSAADRADSVQQTNDGGFAIVGATESFGAGDSDVYLIKTDAAGNELWSKTFGGSGFDDGWAVRQTADGGYVIAGRTRSFGAGNYDVYLIKTDAEGHEVWSRTFGGRHFDAAYSDSVQQTADGGYVIAGHRRLRGTGGSDVILIKTDAEGLVLGGGGDVLFHGQMVRKASTSGAPISLGWRWPWNRI